MRKIKGRKKIGTKRKIGEGKVNEVTRKRVEREKRRKR